jgi:ParB-like chromosome segregation protein Spo0J
MKNIDLDDLFCSIPRENYSEESIDRLALSIDATGGLLRPLIVQMVEPNGRGNRMFEVLDGFLPYWAAIRAEQDNMLLQQVPCWVLADADDLQFALEQLECIASFGCPVDDVDFAMPVRGGV